MELPLQKKKRPKYLDILGIKKIQTKVNYYGRIKRKRNQKWICQI